MIFLIDHQLPPGLKAFFQARELHAIHVIDVGLSTSADSEIWEFARSNSYCLVSKDDDFRNLAWQRPGPRLIWIRLGNCRTTALIAAMEAVWPRLAEWLNSDERTLEIR